MEALLKMPSRLAGTKMDRRMFPRQTVQGWIEGMRLDHSLSARRDPTVALSLRDVSEGGIAAVSDHPLREGEHVSIGFPATGKQPGWDAYGRVIRCDPAERGYEVAIEFDALPAA